MTRYRYSFNEDYFAEIDTEGKAYWLGYILADGSVMTRKSKSSRHYGLALQSIDLELLEKFKRDIDYTGPIKTRSKGGSFDNSKPGHYLVINRMSLSSQLLKYKVDSSCIHMPEVEESLVRHLIRGIFDGDGSVYSWVANETQKTKWGTYHYKRFMMEASIIGCEPLLSNIEAYLSACGIKTRRKKSRTPWMNYLVVSNKPDLHLLRKLFYEGSSIYLQRKFDKWHNTPPLS